MGIGPFSTNYGVGLVFIPKIIINLLGKNFEVFLYIILYFLSYFPLRWAAFHHCWPFSAILGHFGPHSTYCGLFFQQFLCHLGRFLPHNLEWWKFPKMVKGGTNPFKVSQKMAGNG